MPYYLFSETVDSTEAKYDFVFNKINLIEHKAKDNHDGLISYEENSIAFCDNQKSIKALPVCAASDIAGAAVGATQSAIISYTTTGEVNWESVGLSAVGGAIVGSTGIIGKAGKWISNLFK